MGVCECYVYELLNKQSGLTSCQRLGHERAVAALLAESVGRLSQEMQQYCTLTVCRGIRSFIWRATKLYAFLCMASTVACAVPWQFDISQGLPVKNALSRMDT
jgi:hypothetical protein